MRIIGLSLLCLLLFACSDYNKTVKSDDYTRKFETANELFDKGQYARSIVLYEQIYQRFPKTSEGEVAYYRIGKAYYQEEDYYMGGYYLGSFNTRFPYSPQAEEALFLSALCSVKNSPEPSLDSRDTELAINDLQLFINRYPNSTLIDSCNQTIDRLRFKLETKDYEAVEMYARTAFYRAAAVAAMSFNEIYPRSSYKERVDFLLVKNSYLLASKSVESKKMQRIEESIERYRNFVGDFPQSEYKKEVDDYRDELEKLRLSLN